MRVPLCVRDLTNLVVEQRPIADSLIKNCRDAVHEGQSGSSRCARMSNVTPSGMLLKCEIMTRLADSEQCSPQMCAGRAVVDGGAAARQDALQPDVHFRAAMQVVGSEHVPSLSPQAGCCVGSRADFNFDARAASLRCAFVGFDCSVFSDGLDVGQVVQSSSLHEDDADACGAAQSGPAVRLPVLRRSPAALTGVA